MSHAQRSKAVLLLWTLFVICVSCFSFFILSCLFHVALWSPAAKGLVPWLSCVWCFLVCFFTFPYGVLGQVWDLIVLIPDFAFFVTLSCL